MNLRDLKPYSRPALLAILLILFVVFISVWAGQAHDHSPDASERIGREMIAVRWLGVVRHFHPSEAVEEADWNGLYHEALQLAAEHEEPSGFRQSLVDLLGPLTVGMKVVEQGGEVSPRGIDCDDGADPLRWDHKGFNAPPAIDMGSHASGGRKIYESKRGAWPSGKTGIEPESLPSIHRLAVGDGREVVIPLSLCPQVAEGIDMESSHLGDDRLETEELSFPEQARLGVASLWSAFRHFYSYQESVEKDWDEMLEAGLRQARAVEDRADMKDVLGGLIMPLRDGHMRITDRWGSPGNAKVAAEVQWVEDRLITVATPDPDELPIGSEIVRVNDESLDDWWARKARYFGGSEHWRRDVLARVLTGGHEGESLTLHWQQGGESGETTLVYGEGEADGPLNRDALGELERGVAYVDLRAIQHGQIEEMLAHLEGREAVVFDLRGYPAGSVGFKIIGHLMQDESDDWEWMQVMTPRGPGGDLIVREAHGWNVEPTEPAIDAEAVVLMDAGAISYAESVLGMLKRYDLATLVGTPSAGANGNVMALEAPGDLTISQTGMRVIGPDGEPFHGRGIEPHVRVEPTVAGLSAGRDEVLEAGLSVLRDRR